jgi:hypothetical protein
MKYPSQTLTTCTTPCNGNSAQMCGSSDGIYLSVYASGKLKKKLFSHSSIRIQNSDSDHAHFNKIPQ